MKKFNAIIKKMSNKEKIREGYRNVGKEREDEVNSIIVLKKAHILQEK